MDRAEFWLRLLMVKGITNARLITVAGMLNRLSREGNLPYEQPLYVQEIVNSLALTVEQEKDFYHANSRWLSKAMQWLAQQGNRMIVFGEPYYPELLMQISMPPPLLFIQGDPAVLQQPQLAIVGSRHYSQYGAQWSHYFAQTLSGCGWVITSGLALGIDSIAHQGALDAEGKTVAVLGSGLDRIYPRQHQGLAKQIVEQSGCLVTEFLPGHPPIAANFPRRNRIISGLSQGVLVVEASLRSGSLITARYALEQGKEVFALPASLNSNMNAGGHWLIQQGAYLVSQPADILQQLNSSLDWLSLSLTLPTENINVVGDDIGSNGIEKNRTKDNRISGIEESIVISEQQELPFVEVLVNVGEEVTSIDMIAERSGQAVPDIVVKLLELELTGWVKAVSGGYVRIRGAGHV